MMMEMGVGQSAEVIELGSDCTSDGSGTVSEGYGAREWVHQRLNDLHGDSGPMKEFTALLRWQWHFG